MGLSLGSNPRGPESEVDAVVQLDQNISLESEDGTVSFNGQINGTVESSELLFNGQLAYAEEGETRGSTLYHRVAFVDVGTKKVATLSKYPNTPHPIVSVELDKSSGQLTMKITHQDVRDEWGSHGVYTI